MRELNQGLIEMEEAINIEEWRVMRTRRDRRRVVVLLDGAVAAVRWLAKLRRLPGLERG